jgi:hypothetical protein
MQIVSRRSFISPFAFRLATLATLASVPTFYACAQSGAAGASSPAPVAVQSVSVQPAPSAAIFALNSDPLGVFTAPVSSSSASSSSSSSSTISTSVDPDALAVSATPGDPGQPPPRRRYGRPRYNDSSHNPDGSSKYGFLAGVGLTLPTGNTYHYLNTDYAFQVGGGRNFNKNFAINLQFDYDHFGFNGPTLVNQQNLYNYYCTAAEAAAGNCTQISNLDGKSHVWSFTLDPTYTFYTREGLGAYIVGGVGFYHKTANFTVPTVGVYYDPYYGPIEYAANETIDKYTSNAPGFDGGFGLTYKPSRFSSQRLYVEARYVFMDNSQRSGVTIGSSAATLDAYNGNNFFPANSNRTTYIPIKAGIRF